MILIIAVIALVLFLASSRTSQAMVVQMWAGHEAQKTNEGRKPQIW